MTHLTAEGLHNLRSVHRAQHAIGQQDSQVSHTRCGAAQPKNNKSLEGNEQPRVHAIRGSKH
jgi:hypothetical protein